MMRWLSAAALVALLAWPASAVNLPTTPADYSASAALTGTGDVAVQVNGTSTVLISATGTGSGLAWTFQCYDGAGWITASAYPITSGALGAAVSTGSANGDWQANTAACAATGNTGFRVHLTAISGGTETFKLNASAGLGVSPVVLVPGGAVTANAGTNLNTSALALDASVGTTNTDLGPPGATACATDTGSCSLNALLQRLAQRLTTITATLNSPFQAGANIGNTSFIATGTTASGSSITASPLTVGGRAQNAEATAVSNGQVVNGAYTLTGKPIVQPYANPENFVNGTTAAITDTTSTSVIASAGGSLRNYLTHCTATNSHATVGTFVKILDGSTVIYEAYAAAAGGGFSTSYPVPLRGTAATAVNCQAVTTGANFICSCSGYTGT